MNFKTASPKNPPSSKLSSASSRGEISSRCRSFSHSAGEYSTVSNAFNWARRVRALPETSACAMSSPSHEVPDIRPMMWRDFASERFELLRLELLRLDFDDIFQNRLFARRDRNRELNFVIVQKNRFDVGIVQFGFGNFRAIRQRFNHDRRALFRIVF